VWSERPSLNPVLHLLWRERRISRAELARRTDLSRSTVSELIEVLMEHRLVRESGVGESHGGRRPIILEFIDDAWLILGIDVGAAHVSVCLTDLRCQEQAWASASHPVRDDPRGTRETIERLCDQVLAQVKDGAARLLGIGVGVPSPVDPRRPDTLSELVLPAWRGVGVKAGLEARYRVPVLVDNDANLGALAESFWGRSRDVSESCFVKVATGIGSGHIIRGQIYRGASGVAGEIGHMTIDEHGERCLCGLRGCLVTSVGSAALLARAKARGASSSVTASIGALEDAALAGDAHAVAVIEEAADHLGNALANVINLLNPAVVAVGGSIARVGPAFFGPLRAAVRNRTLVTSAAVAEIVPSALGDRVVALGGATLLLQEALNDPATFLTPRRQSLRH
jgi:predicted NBD/HSP70 family sugar kinase